MSKKYSHKEVVDILDILYVKIMRLKNSWKTCCIFSHNPIIENQFPDINYAIKYSFGVDAYTTICALFTSGVYSFQSLSKSNIDFFTEYNLSRSNIEKNFPFLNERRNKVFCHFTQKQSETFINDIILHFQEVFEIIAKLHTKAMEVFGVNYNEIRAMNNDKFEKLNGELEEFRILLFNATLDNKISKVLDKNKFKDVGDSIWRL